MDSVRARAAEAATELEVERLIHWEQQVEGRRAEAERAAEAAIVAWLTEHKIHTSYTREPLVAHQGRRPGDRWRADVSFDDGDLDLVLVLDAYAGFGDDARYYWLAPRLCPDCGETVEVFAGTNMSELHRALDLAVSHEACPAWPARIVEQHLTVADPGPLPVIADRLAELEAHGYTTTVVGADAWLYVLAHRNADDELF